MKKFLIAASLFVLATPAMAGRVLHRAKSNHEALHDYRKRPEPSAGLVIGVPFGVRVEAEKPDEDGDGVHIRHYRWA